MCHGNVMPVHQCENTDRGPSPAGGHVGFGWLAAHPWLTHADSTKLNASYAPGRGARGGDEQIGQLVTGAILRRLRALSFINLLRATPTILSVHLGDLSSPCNAFLISVVDRKHS